MRIRVLDRDPNRLFADLADAGRSREDMDMLGFGAGRGFILDVVGQGCQSVLPGSRAGFSISPMVRNIEALMAQAMAKARAAGNLPPLVLPFAFRGALSFEPVAGRWPRELFMPDGMGLAAVRLWDEIGKPANEAAP